MKRYLVVFILSLIPVGVNAANAWYWGPVTSVITIGSDGSFQIEIDNQTIADTCAYDRIDFKVSDMGEGRTKAALSMAMAALMGSKEFGVVVDLPNPGEACYASSTASQGAGIR